MNEADAENLDRCIERNLHKIAPALTIRRDYGVSANTRFHSDLVIDDSEGTSVCVEIEKGPHARFELDILKMQVFCASRKRTRPKGKTFGAFIVPMHKKVNRSITGASRRPESSFRYLRRLGPLVAEITPLAMEDILIVGYAPSPPTEKGKARRRSARNSNVRTSEKGLLPDKYIEDCLPGPIPELVSCLRRRLAEECPELREKWNCRSRYLGYASGSRSNAVYVYIQTGLKRLKIAVKIPPERADELRKCGFEVNLDGSGFLAKAGLLTGWIVRYDADERDIVLQYLLEALQCG